DRDDEREPHEARLRGAVVRLPEVPAQAGAGDDVDDAAVLLLLHDRERVPAAVEAAVEVHLQHRVEVVGLHVGEALVAQDAGIVDEDVAASPPIERRLHDPAGALVLGDAVVVGDALTAERRDLLADLGGRIGGGAAAAHVAADVVHDDLRTLTRERECDAASDAPARTGDDGDFPFEELAHAT